jgi:hypothetical protein
MVMEQMKATAGDKYLEGWGRERGDPLSGYRKLDVTKVRVLRSGTDLLEYLSLSATRIYFELDIITTVQIALFNE